MRTVGALDLPVAERFAALTAPRFEGFWRRAAAFVLDLVWQAPLVAVAGWLALGSAYFNDASISGGGRESAIGGLLPALVIVGFWWWVGASPGKWLMHMRIVDAHTFAPASKGRLVLRYVAYWLSAVVFGLGYVWIAFDRRKQGWHDKIARTVVIRDDDF